MAAQRMTALDIIKKYEGKLAWWVSEKDSGQAEAINKGLSRAKGEFVAWLNSDDYLMPGAVAAAVKALQAEPRIQFCLWQCACGDPGPNHFESLNLQELAAQRPDVISHHRAAGGIHAAQCA